ncbi:uncharacterized protein BDR25DRAFT_356481 [Lindgomyces ingoldianus]|uniref:Uncharacterized protein n=1 Tax=Lindgomyces ingoldianus TaxID=673940 RepID=A0ACB6QQN4_9PLEO|nr:uncharacterized protein BDR25DRAFT_356481 [Lindgomyces ingoldianus]KAF2469231.1 hypothetical protein BDR25DRAFT_356481 [Lindgomyces ingoldianus]
MGAGSYVCYGSHSSYVSTAHVTATFTYLRVVVRTVGNAERSSIKTITMPKSVLRGTRSLEVLRILNSGSNPVVIWYQFCFIRCYYHRAECHCWSWVYSTSTVSSQNFALPVYLAATTLYLTIRWPSDGPKLRSLFLTRYVILTIPSSPIGVPYFKSSWLILGFTLLRPLNSSWPDATILDPTKISRGYALHDLVYGPLLRGTMRKWSKSRKDRRIDWNKWIAISYLLHIIFLTLERQDTILDTSVILKLSSLQRRRKHELIENTSLRYQFYMVYCPSKSNWPNPPRPAYTEDINHLVQAVTSLLSSDEIFKIYNTQPGVYEYNPQLRGSLKTD